MANLNRNYLKQQFGNDLNEIKEIQLEGCIKKKLNSIDPQAFMGLDNLEEIIIREHEIKEIKSGTFAYLPKLRKIELDNNSIEKLDTGVFKSSTNLKEIYLHCNEIRALEKGHFAGLVNLERIDLHENNLSSIQKDTFKELEKLKRIELYKNKLVTHDKPALDLPQNVTYISVQNNSRSDDTQFYMLPPIQEPIPIREPSLLTLSDDSDLEELEQQEVLRLLDESIKTNFVENMKAAIGENIKNGIYENIKINGGQKVKNNINEKIKTDITGNLKLNCPERNIKNSNESTRTDITGNLKLNCPERNIKNSNESTRTDITGNLKLNCPERNIKNSNESTRTDITGNLKLNCPERNIKNINENIKTNISENIKLIRAESIKQLSCAENIKKNIDESLKTTLLANPNTITDVKLQTKSLENIKTKISENVKTNQEDNIKSDEKIEINLRVNKNKMKFKIRNLVQLLLRTMILFVDCYYCQNRLEDNEWLVFVISTGMFALMTLGILIFDISICFKSKSNMHYYPMAFGISVDMLWIGCIICVLIFKLVFKPIQNIFDQMNTVEQDLNYILIFTVVVMNLFAGILSLGTLTSNLYRIIKLNRKIYQSKYDDKATADEICQMKV